MTTPFVAAATPVYGLRYVAEGQPAHYTRQHLQHNAETIEAALIAGGVAAPGAADLLDLAGEVHDLQDYVYGALAPDVLVALPMTTPMEAASSSAFYNCRFHHWPVAGPVTIPVGGDLYTAGGWRCVSHVGGPSAVISKADPIRGGIKLVITFTAGGQFLYLRQLVPDLSAFRASRWTASFDVETNAGVECDVYVQSRFNSNDGDRVRAADTAQLFISPGRRRLAAAFDVPDFDAAGVLTITGGVANTVVWAENNYLESALRFVSTAAGTVTATVREAVLVPGSRAKGPLHINPATEIVRVEAYHETGHYQGNGFNTASGQRRFMVPFRTKKARTAMAAANITITDAAGNVGKISTYDIAGTRTDNVAYTSIAGFGTPTSYQDGFGLVVGNTSTIAGAAFSYEAKLY